MAIPKSGPDPLADLTRFLKPFAGLVRRSESREAMERYATGLLADQTTPPGRGFPPKDPKKRGGAAAHRLGRTLSSSL